MKYLKLVLAFFTFYFKHLESCKTNPTTTTTATMVSGQTTATLSCIKNQKRRFTGHRDNLLNNSNVIRDNCATVLGEGCVYVDQMRLELTEEHSSKLKNISQNIPSTCNCRNRSMEILCRLLFPECQCNTSATCPTSACEMPRIIQPCSGYCIAFLNRYCSRNLM